MKSTIRLALVCCLSGLVTSARADVSEAEAAHLGKELTPIGAEIAGNAPGTIPAWTGGITAPPAGYKVGDHHPDPFASDQPLYTITAANAAQYVSQLTAGHQALLKAYPDYKLIVYPTHRSASYPQRIYDATRADATSAHLVGNGNGIRSFV